ncbi:MAG: DNA mismatch repair endonuclease MutL [Prevotella sp.]|nr:DNA mismatch repair endonuclease MutL [Prevotella sp.]
MSDVIRLLPDTVANQIAAGEVIQRPASVVKEMVENAVDAGAAHVHVVIVDAGRTSIQVIDDGHGMSETDARLAFERHATSKIRQADDLFDLHTMGFRGEALPSIAAVAQVELTTRMAVDEVGTRLCLAASKVVSQEPVSCPVGSSFKVENLFYNVPVRRKFLKSNATELNNILTAFERIVLVYPAIAFTLHSNGEELLNLRPGSLLQRIADVFGRKFSQELLPVEVSTALGSVSGFVGKPEAARKKGAHQYFFVNGRFMKHAYFHKAVLSPYERLVAEGTQPPYLLYFDVAPADIDVNIHPTKTEIKFENEQSLWQILTAAVKDAIGRFCNVPAIDFDTEGRPDIPLFNPASSPDFSAPPRVSYNPSYNPFASQAPTSAPASPSASSPAAGFPSSATSPSVGSAAAVPQFSRPSSAPASVFDSPVAAPALLADKSPVHYQYKGRYIMTAVKSGLMIIDQHRASVRILFERYLAQSADRPLVSQSVLFPEAVEFAPSELPILRENISHLAKLGFDLADLGGGSYAVNAIPSDVDGDPVSLLRSIIADMAEATKAPLATQRERLALSLARVAAVPYGQLLTNDEMDTITNQLFACSNVNYTPDGRAILCILPQSDIEHLLG